MENTNYARRREGRWTPIRAKGKDTRANPNSWKTQMMGHWTPTGIEPKVYDDHNECKKSRSWSLGPSTAERKRQRKLSGHRLLLLQLFLLYYTLCISTFCLTFYFSNAKTQEAGLGPPTAEPHAMAQLEQWVIRPCEALCFLVCFPLLLFPSA